MRMGLDDLALSLFDELPETNLVLLNLVPRGFCEPDGGCCIVM